MQKALFFIFLILMPFFSKASIFTDGSVPTFPPKIDNTICVSSTYGGLTKTSCGTTEQEAKQSACSAVASDIQDTFSGSNYPQYTYSNATCSQDGSSFYLYKDVTRQDGPHYDYSCYCNVLPDPMTDLHQKQGSFQFSAPQQTIGKTCPPDENPLFTYPIFGADGEINACANPSQIPLGDSCNINDSPNVSVTSANACYTKSDGSKCSVTAVDVGGGNQVYQGSEGNCYTDPQPDVTDNPSSGSTPTGDTCTNNGGLLACPEDPANVCSQDGSTYGGGSVNNCQSGCGYVNDQFICYDTDTNDNGIPDYKDDASDTGTGDTGTGTGDTGTGDTCTGNSCSSGSGGSVDIDLQPVVDAINQTNSKLDDLNKNFDKSTTVSFKEKHGIDALNSQYTAEIKSLSDKTASELGYVDNISLGSESLLSNAPADGCGVYIIPVGLLGDFSIDLCFVSNKIQPFLFYLFAFLTSFYVFFTVNSVIRGST